MNGFNPASLRERTFRVVFGTDTRAGRVFDLSLMLAIFLSVATVMADSVESIKASYHTELVIVEWLFTALFTVEYFLRLWCVKKPKGYALSFFGVIDLVAVLPTYFSLLWPGVEVAAVLRLLRVVRVFRILKLVQYIGGTAVLLNAVARSRFRITVFLVAVAVLVTIVGSIMYLIEGPSSGFTSIPEGVYWAIVTLTTVGYGDIAPVTPLGQVLASLLMLMGYALIAVPMGLIISETSKPGGSSVFGSRSKREGCVKCPDTRSDPEVHYCSYCGKNVDQMQIPSL